MQLTFDLGPGDERLFIDESLEQIEKIESGLLGMERGEADANVVNEVFRAAHTLKGSAGTIGHTRMQGLTHAMEDVFGALRSGTIPELGTLADPLLATIDVLRDLLEEVSAGHVLADPAALTAELRARLTAATSPAGSAPAASSAPAGGASATALSEAVLHRLLGEAPEGVGPRSIVRIVVDESCEWASVRLYQAVVEATESGYLLACVPSREEIEGGLAERHLILLVKGDEAALGVLGERLMMIDDIGVEEVIPLEKALAREAGANATAAAPGPAEPALGAAGAIAAVTPAGADQRAIDLGVEARGLVGEEKERVAGERLRTAEQTIRIDVSRLDDLMNLVGELVAQKTRLLRQASQLHDLLGDDPVAREAEEGAQQFSRIAGQLQDQVTGLRMLPIESVFNRFPRVVRDVAAKLGKEVALIVEGKETELDRSVLQEIGDPLGHLIRNALDHGIETPEGRIAAGKPAEGQVRLNARHADGMIVITVEDDGQGMDANVLRQKVVEKGLMTPEQAAALTEQEALGIIFLPGFSTAVRVTDVSGRGVGMDVVRTNIERIGGRVEIKSSPGAGTRIMLSLPLTLAIISAMLVRSGKRVCCLPLTGVVETLRVEAGAISTIRGLPVINLRDRVVPIAQLDGALGDVPRPIEPNDRGYVNMVVVRSRDSELALAVDEFVGQQEIVLKSMSAFTGRLLGISGGTIMADGTVGLVVDIGAVLDRSTRSGKAA
jgi:two-component system, chemotaxis family, sensor kinase CheA